MKKTFAFIELHSKKIEITTGVISVITSGVGFLGQFAAWELLISIVLIGAFFVLKSILNGLRRTPNSSAIFRILYWLNFLLIPIALSLLAFWFLRKDKGNCNETNSNPVVCISRFSSQEDDDFSYALVSDLAELIKENDSVSIASVDTFLNQNVFFDLVSLENIIDANCHDKGLVVFGKYSGTNNLFNCSIYVSKNFESKYSQQNLIENQLVKLKNPVEITFSIESHSKLVTDIILMLLDYYNGDIKKCISTISVLFTEQGDSLSLPIRKLLLIYLSNAQALSGDLNSSMRGYENLLELDSLSDVANYNYALLLLEQGKSDSANFYFERAKSINSSLEFPNKSKGIETIEKKSIDSISKTQNPVIIQKSELDTSAKQTQIIPEPKREITSEVPAEKKSTWSQFPRNCIVKKLSETNFIVYDLKNKKLGQYSSIWPAESREMKNLQKKLNASFYFILRDGYYGAIDDNGRVIMRPSFEDSRSLERAIIEAFGNI
jgi:hypothetical protein